MPVIDIGIRQQARDVIGGIVGNGIGGPGIAVMRSVEHFLGADGARGARLVDHDHIHAQGLSQDRRGDPGHLVGRAAGAPGHDQVDRAIGLPFLRGDQR
ncbi:hypothetical protein D3C72_1843700 [compost metagenome]